MNDKILAKLSQNTKALTKTKLTVKKIIIHWAKPDYNSLAQSKHED